MKLQIGDGLSLPLDFVTQTQAILAIKRVGKSYTASVQAEELLKAGQQIVAIDVTGAWWGLRSNAAGNGPGFPILIAGGDHGDIPLEENAGEVLAEALVSERFSAIIDVSLFRKGQAQRFLAVFFETLYRRNREAMHLFMDEADFYAPQKPFGEEARTLGAVNDIVRRGGIRGIGSTLITQRASVLNKDVLTQCGILTCLRIIHPRDMGAVKEWVNVHADPRLQADMERSLPNLPKGEAWVWAPGWPTESGIFQRVKIRTRETFDSGATPKAGQVVKAPKVVAQVDIAKLGQQIAATAQRVKENDPKELKKRIAELERQARATPATSTLIDEQAITKAVEKAVAQRDSEHRAQLAEHQAIIEKMQSSFASIGKTCGQYVSIELPKEKHAPVEITLPPAPRGTVSRQVIHKPVTHSGSAKLPPGERAVLIAAAQYSDGVERDQLSVLTGYKRSSRDAYIQRLREKAYVDVSGARILATDEGITALGDDYEPLPAGDALREYWINRLPEGERRVLEFLIGHNGDPVSREAIDDATGYKRSSRDAYLQRLSSRRLVVSVGRGEVKAVDDLFD